MSSSNGTTSGNNNLNIGAHGELSPPRSQDPIGEQGPVVEMEDAPPSTEMLPEDVSPVNDFKREDGGKYVPGAAWKSKRAQEDFQRAIESVIDRDFSLKEFGDPLIDTKHAR